MNTSLAETWGRAIRDQRAARGLSQDDLAAELGVSQGTISKWERGLNLPPHALVPKIARALGTVPSVLFQYPVATA